MSLTIALLLALGGLAVLAGGGELLVRGAISASRQLRIPPAVVGLTIVAFATSLPELAVSLLAALRGSPDVAVGNVVGSNIFNIAAIVGLSAMLFPPLYFRSAKLRLDFMMMLLAGACAIFFSRDLFVGRWEGISFLAVLAVFLILRVKGVYDENQRPSGREEPVEPAAVLRGGVAGAMTLVFVGAGLLTVGAELLVRGAVVIADKAGVSERVIAITLVSAGTGLPELATAIIAGLKKHTSVAVGNVIGSNIFNVFAILGTVAVVSPVPVARPLFRVDMWWMLAFSVIALFPVFVRHKRLARIAGGIVFVVYITYVVTLF
jgi:cation:H+ antiporter